MLAKLISGLHKPDDQTTMPPPLATGFMATLPVRAIPGVGYKMNSQLKTQLGEWTGLAKPLPSPPSPPGGGLSQILSGLAPG